MANCNLFSNHVSSPCKDCVDREIGCHSTCEKYINFQREREAYNKKVREARKKESDILSFKIDSIRQYNKTGSNNRKSVAR